MSGIVLYICCILFLHVFLFLCVILENTIEVEVCRDDSVNELFAFLSGAGIKVLSMRNKTNRLEELFMNLVENGSDSRAHS